MHFYFFMVDQQNASDSLEERLPEISEHLDIIKLNKKGVESENK